MNDLILRPLITTGYVYATADINTLYSIANQCPLAGGNSVYQARNLLMSIANNVIAFPDNCIEASKRSMIVSGSSPEDKINEAFKLYPNPNNGNMLLDYLLNANEKGIMTIYDISGKLISRYILENSINQLSINNEKLKNGIYFYQIIVNDKVVKNDKLVIIK